MKNILALFNPADTGMSFVQCQTANNITNLKSQVQKVLRVQYIDQFYHTTQWTTQVHPTCPGPSSVESCSTKVFDKHMSEKPSSLSRSSLIAHLFRIVPFFGIGLGIGASSATARIEAELGSKGVAFNCSIMHICIKRSNVERVPQEQLWNYDVIWWTQFREIDIYWNFRGSFSQGFLMRVLLARQLLINISKYKIKPSV